MTFVKPSSAILFSGNIRPRLISIYQANGLYTEMPRAMHRHEDALECILITSGFGVHIINGQRYYTEKGDLLIINRGIVHDESCAENIGLSIYSCAMTGLQLPGLPAGYLLPENCCPILKVGADLPIFEALLQLIADYMPGHPHAEEFANHMLCAFLTAICGIIPLQTESLTEQDNLFIRQIRAYIDHNYTNELTLQQLADHFHVSTYYLAHCFKHSYGYAPIQYVMRRRIGEAQTLLIDTSRSITDIALQVGYNSSSYFNKAFHKVTGLSPKQYRNAYRQI